MRFIGNICLSLLVFCTLSTFDWNSKSFVQGKDVKRAVEEAKETVANIISNAYKSITTRKSSAKDTVKEAGDRIISHIQDLSRSSVAHAINRDVKLAANFTSKFKLKKEDKIQKLESEFSQTTTTASSRMQKVLDDHLISKSHHREIVGLSGANIQRESVISHVMSNHPEKSKAEVNDIIIAANIASGSLQPRESDMTKEDSIKKAKNLKKFEKSKEEFSKLKNKE